MPVLLRSVGRERVSGLERRLGLEAVLSAVIEESRGPARIGRFVVQERLGRGTFGVVYRAFDPELGREVAIKIPRTSCQPANRERARHEARALARAAHPNVVAVHEVGCHDGEPYLVMEFIEGETLDIWTRRWRPGCAALLDACMQAGRGLAAAHRAGVVHRDFKPANVMVGRDGRVRVADFGVAAFPENRKGLEDACTPHFAAPEVLADGPADARSDQYSYCRSVLEVMSGCPMRRVLEPVLNRGCAERAEDRWPDLDAVLAAMAAN